MGEHKLRVYRDRDDRWRWSRVAGNGEIVADSGEGYEHRVDCLDSMVAVNRYPFIVIIEVCSAVHAALQVSGSIERHFFNEPTGQDLAALRQGAADLRTLWSQGFESR